MVTRVFTGDDEAYVPDLGRWVRPGDEVEFASAEVAPDTAVWQTPGGAKKAAKARKPRKSAAVKQAAKNAPPDEPVPDVLDPDPSDAPVVPEAPVTEES